MSRPLTIAACQLGPIERGTPRGPVVARLVALLREAHRRGASVAVFPEMALTTFFPRWTLPEDELARMFEREMPGPETQPLFDEAARLGMGFCLGYCEETPDGRRYNTAILVERGAIVGKYRKVHVPGDDAPDPAILLPHLERYYFRDGDLGIPVFPAFGAETGMLICNDRRWPEPWRVLGLQGAELVCLGFNSPSQLPDAPEMNPFRTFHHLVPMQAAAYQNGIWIVATAKAGREGGCDMMGNSCIIAPSGEVVAISSTLGDEVVSATIDLAMCAPFKRFFDFARYRRPDAYRLITERKAAGPAVIAHDPGPGPKRRE